MKFIVSLGLLWACLAIAIGLAGAVWLQRSWKSSVESDLVHAASAVAFMVGTQTWTSPLEADPAWSELERRLGLNLVPTPKAIGAANLVRWQPTVAGYRITTNARLAEKVAGMQWLQVSRSIDPLALTRIWWICWSILNVGVVAIFVCFAHILTRDVRRRNGLLQAWVESSRRGTTRGSNSAQAGGLLDTFHGQNSEQAFTMSIIADAVNRVYAQLESANERSELVFGNLREGVLAIDDRSEVLLANKALLSLLDIAEGTYLHRPFLEVVRAPAVANLVSQVIAEQQPQTAEVEYGKQTSFLRILARPLPMGDGRCGALITVRDETQIKRADLIRRDFVANASHELKTPLAAIRAYAETLQLGALDDRTTAEQFVANIIAQADRINGLVQGMLQLSRVEVGTALNFQRCDVLEALQPCLAAARAVAQSKGVEMVVQTSHDNMVICCDRDGFQAIASNLLSNAVRYTDAGGEVSVLCDLNEQVFRLTVQDTGIGITPQDLERVFERFYRAEKDRSSDTGGTGLGLSIVKHLTQALGGSVHASSQHGRGSVFVVELPVDRSLP